MKTVHIRRAIMTMALAGGLAFLASPAFAQPSCGSVASLMNAAIYQDGPGAVGDNLLSIPAVSPINVALGPNNGFKQLCNRFGLTGTTSLVIQFDAQAGNITTFQCDQAAAPPFTAGQAVLIRPTASGNGRIPGVECSQSYTTYIEGAGALGDNLFPVPLTATAADPQVLCGQLNLVNNSQVIRFDAQAGNIQSHLCGQVPVFNLVLGEAVLIRPLSTATGAAIIY
jgi:hypothetical protein